MENSSAQEVPIDNFQATLAHAPKPGEDASQRAIFIASSLALTSADFLHSLISSLRQGQFGTELQQASFKTFSEYEFGCAVKELTCISIFLIAIEQGSEDCPDWLKAFLTLCLKATDLLVTQPCAQEIMQTHEFLTKDDVITEASIDICRRLGFKENLEKLLSPLLSFMNEKKRNRNALLKLALTEATPQLHEHLANL